MPDGSRKSRTFTTKKPAELWAAEVTRRRELGSLAQLVPSPVTLEQLGIEWLHGPATELAPSTRRTISGVIERHIMRWIGQAQVSHIDAPFVQSWQASLIAAGVSPDPRSRALKYLRMLLNFGMELGYCQSNPAQAVRMPKLPPSDPVRPLSPTQIESLRRSMGFPRDKLNVSLMAYAGLRPQESVALKWADIGRNSISVLAPKTNRRDSVKLLAPLRAELLAWRAASGSPPADALVLPLPKAAEWSRSSLNNWRRRIFDPACERAGIDATPYTLRHSFASLLVHGGYPLTYVARQMRHSLDMTTRRYANVIEDFDPSERIDVEQEIWRSQGAQNGHRSIV